MKLKKTLLWAVASLPTILTVTAICYFTYYLVEKDAGHRVATIAAILPALFLTLFTAYALYDVRIRHRGESLSSLMDRQTNQMMKLARPKVLAIILLPIVLPVFASIYSKMLFVMLWLVCLPMGDFCDQWPIVISLAVLGISIFFAIGTCVWLWKQMKKMYPGKPWDNTKLA